MPLKDKEARKEYTKEYHKQYYQRRKHDPEYLGRLQRHRKEQRQRNRAWFAAYKATVKCDFCGIDIADILDHHHIDPKTKKYNVSEMINAAVSIDLIKEEIAKCAIICANHHRLFEAAIKLRKLNPELFDRLMAQ